MGKELKIIFASDQAGDQLVKISALNIHSSKNLLTDLDSGLTLKRETQVESPIFSNTFDLNAVPRSAADQCLEYRRSDYDDEQFPELIFDLGQMKIMTTVQVVSRAEIMTGCGALYSSYLNGIEVATSPTLRDEDFKVCEHDPIPVLNEIGGAIDVMPRVGTEIWCGRRKPRPERYVRIRRNAKRAASDRWVICHLGIYALVVPRQDRNGNSSSVKDGIGFTGGFGIGGHSAINFDGDFDLFDNDSILDKIIDGLTDEIKDSTGIDLNTITDTDKNKNKDDFTSDDIDVDISTGKDKPSTSTGGGSSDVNVSVDQVIDNDLLRKLGYFNIDAAETIYQN